MTAVSTILTDVGYDLKLSTTQQTSRQAELISYMNRVIRNGIMPTLIRFHSDYGLKNWTATEVTEYKRNYPLPSDFVSFEHLYCIDAAWSGTLGTSTATTSITISSTGSTGDDVYNGMELRVTTGTDADDQAQIVDYDGGTVTATLSSALTGTPTSTDKAYIFPQPSDDDELEQMPLRNLYNEYNSNGDPEAYALDRNTNIVLGNIPTDTTHVLYGQYFNLPTLLSASSDALPYDEIFDEVVRQYTSMIGMNRDEYDINIEASIYGAIQTEVLGIIRKRGGTVPGVTQSKIYGSNE